MRKFDQAHSKRRALRRRQKAERKAARMASGIEPEPPRYIHKTEGSKLWQSIMSAGMIGRMQRFSSPRADFWEQS